MNYVKATVILLILSIFATLVMVGGVIACGGSSGTCP